MPTLAEIKAALADKLSKSKDKAINIPVNLQRFLTNPQAFTELVTGKNPMPQETGFAAAATGLPAKEGTVMDPNYQAYMRGYESGEPISYAAMAAPATVPVAKALAPKAGQMAEQYMMQQGMMPSLIAYHGTPHTIKGKFDTSKVGTGEGSQAYGHGMYFAENPAVASEYQKTLSGTKFKEKATGDIVDTRDIPIDKMAYLQKNYEPIIGNLYKVDIPDEHIPKMINWDTPFAKQPRDLRNLFAKVNPVAVLQKDPSNEFTRWLRLKDTVQELQNLGYKGIKYKDSASRGTGKGTSNFVVFDPSDVKILEKNNEPIGPLSNLE